MALYAIENLDDAMGVTRDFLTPVERGTWARLAFVALFVGGAGTNVFTSSMGGNGNGGVTPGEFVDVEVAPWVWLLVAGIVVGVVVLALAFLAVGSIMEFVFVESLRDERVTVRRYWGRRWRQGLRLFAFRVALGLVVLAGVLLVAAPFLLPLFGISSIGTGLFPAALLVLVPVFLVVALVVAVVHGFTTDFVVPVMIAEDVGVLAGWRRLWPTIAAHWRQYLAYAVAGLLLSMLGGIAVGIATVGFLFLLLLPFGLLFAAGYGLFAFVAAPLGIAVFVVGAILLAVTILAFVALVQVPVKTYLRYYALLVLGDIEPDFDLIPAQRSAVREHEPSDESSGAA